MKKCRIPIFILLLLILMSVLIYWFVIQSDAKASNFTIPEKGTGLKGYTIIIHTNDTHGRVERKIKKKQMGFTAVSELKKYYEAAGAEVILLDAGDTLQGTDFVKNGKGKKIVSIMNFIGYDAMTPGNNDFNYGTKTLLKRAGKMEFPLLSANITYKKDKTAYLKDSFILEKNGVKYGIFGLTTTDTVIKEKQEDTDGVEIGNPVTAATTEVEKLRGEGADKIIALTHLGINDTSEYTSKALAKEVKGIDLIVDGHSHTALVNGLKINDTLIVNTGKYMKHIGIVIISPDGSMKAQLVDSKDFTGADSAVDDLIKSLK